MGYEGQERMQREEKRQQRLYRQFVTQIKERISQEDNVGANRVIKKVRNSIPITEQRLIELVALEQQIKERRSKLKKEPPFVLTTEIVGQVRQMIQEKIAPLEIIAVTGITPKQLETMIEVKIAEGEVEREAFFEGETLKGMEKTDEIEEKIDQIEAYVNIGGRKIVRRAQELILELRDQNHVLTKVQRRRISEAIDKIMDQEKLQEVRRYQKQGTCLESAVRLQPNIELSYFYRGYVEEIREESSR